MLRQLSTLVLILVIMLVVEESVAQFRSYGSYGPAWRRRMWRESMNGGLDAHHIETRFGGSTL